MSSVKRSGAIALFGLVLMIMSGTVRSQHFGNVARDLKSVSLVALIANPEKYEGRRVRIKGPAFFDGDGDTVCLSKSDIEGSISVNCLSLLIDLEKLGLTRGTLESPRERYVLVEGRFDPSYRGLHDLTSGSLGEITRVVFLDFARAEPSASEKQ